jgi:hypothetical protein
MSLTAEGGPEADAGARKPVAAGRAEQNRVKVERERSDRTLRRFCGANRWGWRAPAAAGVHKGESGERSGPDAGPRGGKGRVPPVPIVGGGGVGGAKPGQGGGRTRHYLEAVLRCEQGGPEIGAGGASRLKSVRSGKCGGGHGVLEKNKKFPSGRGAVNSCGHSGRIF